MPFVVCPDCDAESTAPRELIGLEWNCPKCGASFVVEDAEPRAQLRRHKRNSPGPWVAVLALVIAALFVFGILAFAVSRASRPPEKTNQSVRAEKKPAPVRHVEEPDTDDSPGIGRLVIGFIALFIVLPFYLAPTLIALARGHNNIAPIFVVNFFLGWLLIGWVISLSWAFTDLKHLDNRRRSYL